MEPFKEKILLSGLVGVFTRSRSHTKGPEENNTKVTMTDSVGRTNLSQVPTPESELDKYGAETWYNTLAGVMGNVLEWYDFALFGFFSGE